MLYIDDTTAQVPAQQDNALPEPAASGSIAPDLHPPTVYAPPSLVTDLDQCAFYHTMEVPGFGLVAGRTPDGQQGAPQRCLEQQGALG